MPRIKISGITNMEDAKWAAILGVEFVSVSLEENSDKKVSFSMAKEIRNMLPSYTGFVAEFGELSQMNMREVKKLAPGYIQLKNELLADIDEVKKRISELDAQVIYSIRIPKNPDTGLGGSGVTVNSTSDTGGGSDKAPVEVTELTCEVGRIDIEDCDKGNPEISQENLAAGIPKIALAADGIKLLQVDLAGGLNEDLLKELKAECDMENTIIEGDWELPEIKKACEVLQPYAWSIKSVIEKSPRKIDYGIMKKYIREISLW